MNASDGGDDNPFEYGQAVLHHPDREDVILRILLAAGRAPTQIEVPTVGGRYECFRLQGWRQGQIHYDFVAIINRADS